MDAGEWVPPEIDIERPSAARVYDHSVVSLALDSRRPRDHNFEADRRTKAEVEALFAGHDLVEPGVVWVLEWRPDALEDVGDNPESSVIYAGIGRKP